MNEVCDVNTKLRGLLLLLVFVCIHYYWTGKINYMCVVITVFSHNANDQLSIMS